MNALWAPWLAGASLPILVAVEEGLDLTAWLSVFEDTNIRVVLLIAVALLLCRVGSAIPTRRTFVLLGIPFLLILLGSFSPPLLWLSDWWNIILCLTLVFDRYMLSIRPEEIGLQRTYSPRVSLGRDNPVTLNVLNRSRFALAGRVTDMIPVPCMPPNTSNCPERAVRVKPGQAETFTYEVHPLERGRHLFGAVCLKYHSGLGLLWIIKKQHLTQAENLLESPVLLASAETPAPSVAAQGIVATDAAQALSVYPDLVRIRQMRVKYTVSQLTGELVQRRMGVAGSEFAGLRSYVQGDDIRKIHWKATARALAPVVRIDQPEIDQPVLVLLDAGRKMQTRYEGLTKLDWALNAALSFAGVAIDRGDQVGVGAFHQKVIANVPLRSGKLQMNLLLDRLHDLQCEALEPDYTSCLFQLSRQLKRRSLVVLFTDLIDPIASEQLLQSLKLFIPKHLLIVVTLGDSAVEATAQQYPKTPFDACQKSVAQDLLNERRKLNHRLSTAYGATVIDTVPEAMDESLIQTYLEIKRRNRL